jgi:hypothetical protein
MYQRSTLERSVLISYRRTMTKKKTLKVRYYNFEKLHAMCIKKFGVGKFKLEVGNEGHHDT